jgi:acyl carrier protein phosphodiesterase
MNYLAHLLLADDTDASRIGNLLGDFTRGPMEELAKLYPAELVRGIKMHRAVDSFTDAHEVFRRSRILLSPERRRFAGIIVDIFFDHYLCLHWKQYCQSPLEEFIEEVYQALDEHPEWRAGRLADAFPMMRSENWLMTYTTIEGIGLTLDRVSRRSPRISKIAGGAEDLRENYEAFEKKFHEFMPDLVKFADEWKKEN